MSKKKTYAVFGLGRYGQAVARELNRHGAEVLVVDRDEATVNMMAGEFSMCKCADVTDPEVIRQLGIANVDEVIVAMAGNLESSVMTVTLCKEVGVKRVIAKCANEMHMKILSRIGADEVVFPEKESGIRLAQNLLSAGFVDMVALSQTVSMVEMDMRPEWVGKNLIQLDLRRKYSINVLALRKGEEITVRIDPAAPLDPQDKLIVIANTEQLASLR